MWLDSFNTILIPQFGVIAYLFISSRLLWETSSHVIGARSSRSHPMLKTTDIAVSKYHDEPLVAVASFFNGITVPPLIPFTGYVNKRQRHVLHGEGQTLDYNGSDDAAGDNDYYVAVYDAKLKLMEVFPAPVVEALVTARLKRRFDGPDVKLSGQRFATQRNALGEAFGTKKAKLAIANLERNRIDADKLLGMELDIVDTVREGTGLLPSKDHMEKLVVEARPTPPCNPDATLVSEVYPVLGILLKAELAAIRVQPIMDELDHEAQLAMMPHLKLAYLAKHLPAAVALGNTRKVQLLYYISLLLGVYASRRVRDKQMLLTRLHEPAAVLLDGVLERFTVPRTLTFGKLKDRLFTIDPHHEDKLLCYMLALMMHVDSFLVELPPLANELQMKPLRLVSLFKALGATIKSATVGQAEAFGVPKSQAANHKVATLKVPFKLPQMTRIARKT